MDHKKVVTYDKFNVGNPLFVQTFLGLCASINDKRSNSDLPLISAEAAANFVLLFQKFMEMQSGRHSSQPRVATKIPIAVFQDLKEKGALHNFLLVALKVIDKQGLIMKEVAMEHHKCLIEIWKTSESVLSQAGHIKRPIVYLSKVPHALVDKLSKIVKKHCGHIVRSIEEASHVIEWNEEVDNFPEELADNFIRILEVKTEHEVQSARVHWWYFPDCYDEWIPASEINSSDPPDVQSVVTEKKKWNVCCRFVLDCDRFNEWGAEADYDNLGAADDEVPSTADQMNQSSSLGKKNKGRRKVGSALIRTYKEAPVPHAVLGTERVLSDLAPLSSGGGAARILDLLAVGASETGELKYEGLLAVPNNSGGKSRKFESTMSVAADAKPPAWFNPALVGAEEELWLADVLQSSNERVAYVKVRNAVLALYALSPSQYLSATDCRRKLAGDVNLILRVHEFLNAFSVINHSVRRESRPALIDLTSRMPSAPLNTSDSEWSAAEDAALLVAVKMSGGDWNQVSELLGGTSPEKCFARFVQISVTQTSSSNRIQFNCSTESDSRHGMLREAQRRQAVMVESFMSTRFAVLNEKAKLLANIENVVEVSREQQDVERRDLQLNRAQLAHHSTSGPSGLGSNVTPLTF